MNLLRHVRCGSIMIAFTGCPSIMPGACERSSRHSTNSQPSSGSARRRWLRRGRCEQYLASVCDCGREPAPSPQIVGVNAQAEDVGSNKAPLPGAQPDHADDHAVGACNHPPLPHPPPHQEGGNNREQAGKIIAKPLALETIVLMTSVTRESNAEAGTAKERAFPISASFLADLHRLVDADGLGHARVGAGVCGHDTKGTGADFGGIGVRAAVIA